MILVLALPAAASILMTGCGGSAANGAATPEATTQAPAVMALSPTSTTLQAGTTAVFTVTTSGTTDSSVVWMVNGIAGGNSAVGTITGTGNTATYTAPVTAGSYTVAAWSGDHRDKSGSATVKVVAPGTVSVSLSPSSASLACGGSASFTAAVSGSSDTAVVWSVDGVAGGSSTAGTLAGTGLTVTYTAPATAGSHTLVATSSADSTKSASAAISVVAGMVTVSTSPASATLDPGGTVSLSATVGGTSNTAVTWTVDGVAGGSSTVGTITGSGDTVTYTAPATTGSHTVTATSVASSSSSASTAVSVQTSSGSTAVALSCAGWNPVNVGGSMLFTATVTGSTNTAVTWSVDGVAGGNATAGTINGSGNTALYLAPAAAGSHTVTATSAADTTKSGSTAVTVGTVGYTVVNPSNVYNVKTGYGATGNGSTDDTAAIQNAINAATGAGGGLVEVPSGTYMINLGYQGGEIGLLMKSNVTLQLDAGATLKAMAGAPSTSSMVQFSSGSNMNLVGPGTLEGNKATLGLDEDIKNICFWGGSNIVLAGFTSQNAPGDGIYIDGYPSGCGTGAPVTNVTIYGVTCTGNGRNGMSPVGCNGLVVRDSVFSNQASANPMNGIDIEPINNQAPNNYAIFNCQFTGNKGGGIQSGPDDSGDNATFTNMTYAFNTVSGNGNYGIEAQDGAGPVNILYNTVSGTTSSYEFPGYGIMTRGSSGIKNVTILGNSVTTSGSDGIYLANATSSTCTGNTVTDNGGEGIYNCSGSGMVVSNNTESGNAGGD